MSKGRDTKTVTRPSPKRQSVGSRTFERAARTRHERTSRRTTGGGEIETPSPLLRVRRLLGRVPRAAWLCVLLACLNAICWSLLTPLFEVPDEPAHYAYVKQLAETGHLPSLSSAIDSPDEMLVLEGLRQADVRQHSNTLAITSSAEQEVLDREVEIAKRFPQHGTESAGVATSEPPLYYAFEAIPYSIASSIPGRLELMRLFSALFAGVTALFCFLFVRETLPGAPWAWTVGGLSAALNPLLGFISGAVNPDAQLFAVSAAIFFFLARAFRRHLSPRLGAAIGATIVVGLLTKLNFVGLLPGIGLGLLILGVRTRRALGPAIAYRSLGLAIGIPAVAIAIYLLANVAGHRPVLGLVSAGALLDAHASVLKQLAYIWELYLPRLPGMPRDFVGLFTARDLWFNGYVGFYGWLDTTFPSWVYSVALLPALAIGALAVRCAVVHRTIVRLRLSELAVYALMALGLLVLIGTVSFVGFPHRVAEFVEPRYLLPLLPLLAAVFALAARGAGKRWGPAVGVLLVLLVLAHDIFSQLLVVSRFYG